MLEGIVGIFVVMVLVFLVIFILSRTFDRKKDDDTDKKGNHTWQNRRKW